MSEQPPISMRELGEHGDACYLMGVEEGKQAERERVTRIIRDLPEGLRKGDVRLDDLLVALGVEDSQPEDAA